MPVIGFAFDTFEGRRDKAAMQKAEIKVNSAPKINDVKEIAVPTLEQKALSIAWEFNTSYDPDIGELKIAGELLYLTGEKDNKAALAEWKKKKMLPEKDSIEILNHLFRRCLIKASNIAEDLQLPPPLNLPVVKAKE